MNDQDQAQDEHRELNNELVVPAYRSFCAELELPFHFWDELPRSEFGATIGRGEGRLHPEAMNIFNHLKPELVFFKGSIVSYQFTDWAGDFKYEKTPVNQFLEEAADQLFYLRQLEERFGVVCSIVVGVVSFLAYVAALWLLLTRLPEQLALPSTLVALAVPISLGVWLSRLLRRMPKRIVDDGRLKGLVKRVRDLQGKLAELRGNRPSPLRQQTLGSLLLSELRESMSDEEIRRLVRRLQSRLFVVPSDEP